MIKVKKEIRWLVFMLAPFVCLLGALFLIPMEFLLNSFQVQDEANLNLKLDLDQYFTRSLVNQNSEIITSKLQSFQQDLAWCTNLLIKPSTNYLEIVPQAIKLNNAFEFYQKNKDSNQTEKISMWFATNITNTSSLSSNQILLMNSYKKAEPFIRAKFNGSQLNGITGISICIQGNNADLYFEYPSSSKFPSLNSITMDSYCNETLLNYEIANKQNPYTTFADDQVFRFCGVLALSNLRAAVCLNIDTTALAIQLYASMQLDDGIYTKNNFFLLSPHFDGAENFPSILLNDKTIDLTNYPSGDTSLLTPLVTPALKKYFMNKRNATSFYQIPILITNESNHISVNSYVLVESILVASSIDSSQSSQDLLKILLAPILTIPLVTILISLFFLRKILHTMEDELQNLNNRCKFIIEGDLDIQIPQYSGSKDFQIIYDRIRIINRIHKYTSPEYFKGHFANKILKYNDALSLFKCLGYDQGFLLENIGECYLHIEEFDKSITALSESVEIILRQIQDKFESFSSIYQRKIFQEKLTLKYKQLELILIRRLWKMIFALFKILQFQFTTTKTIDDEIEDQTKKIKKKEKLQEMMHYGLNLIKKAMYPNYFEYSEAMLTWIFETKYYISLKNFVKARECLQKSMSCLKVYTNEYEQIYDKLKKDDKHVKYLRKRCKLTTHSRTYPSILKCFINTYHAVILQNEPYSYKRYYQAFCYLAEGVKGNLMTQSVQYLAINEMVKILKVTGLGIQKLSCTQIFRQSMPLRTLFLGDIHQANQAQLHKFINLLTPGLQREYIFLFDFSKNHLESKLRRIHQKYLNQQYTSIFDKIIKNNDRISIGKCNTQIIFETICNLTLKQSNQQILKNELVNLTKVKHGQSKSNFAYGLSKIIYRIRNLESEKIIFVTVKHISCYVSDFNNAKKKLLKGTQSLSPLKRKKSLKQMSFLKANFDSGECPESRFGDELIQIFEINKEIKNCKIIIFCGSNDNEEKVRKFFGLEDINKRLWKDRGELNVNNNVVYIIDQKHKKDVPRILMMKCANVPDNHAFIL